MTPNTTKPTVEEVGDTELCWYWHGHSWDICIGGYVRRNWSVYLNEAWLPYSAIPDPNNTQQGEPT